MIKRYTELLPPTSMLASLFKTSSLPYSQLLFGPLLCSCFGPPAAISACVPELPPPYTLEPQLQGAPSLGLQQPAPLSRPKKCPLPQPATIP